MPIDRFLVIAYINGDRQKLCIDTQGIDQHIRLQKEMRVIPQIKSHRCPNLLAGSPAQGIALPTSRNPPPGRLRLLIAGGYDVNALSNHKSRKQPQAKETNQIQRLIASGSAQTFPKLACIAPANGC